MSAPNPPQAQRPRRLVPRYPVQAEIRLRTASGDEHSYPARDVSAGGIFLSTDFSLEIFTDVLVSLSSASQPHAVVPARVVHIVSPERAKAFGIPAGMGLQFEPREALHHAAIEALVNGARSGDPRPRVPRIALGVDLAAARQDPILAYVLSEVDGERDIEALSVALAMDLDSTDATVRELIRLGVVELVALGAESVAPSPRVAASAAKRAVPQSAPVVARLDEDTRGRLDGIWPRILQADHYIALGVAQNATMPEIRAEFFELAKWIHPDRYFGRCIGEDLGRLERAFSRLNEAYGVLGRGASRAEYDAYLKRQNAWIVPSAVVSPVVVEPIAPARASVTAVPRVAPPVHELPSPPPSIADAATRRAGALSALVNSLGPKIPAGRQNPPTLSLTERCIEDAEVAVREGRFTEAARRFSLLRAMDVEGRELQERVERVRVQIARNAAMDFEKQALYEERHQKWADAALSWLKVVEGRAHDALPHRRAALALLEAQGDVRRAIELAKQAVTLKSDDPQNHQALGRLYLAAGMKENARRVLEVAKSLGRVAEDGHVIHPPSRASASRSG
jgi:tetratricopeptide (TPR) repeat protein/Tfp pilus assembly protein PilZ